MPGSGEPPFPFELVQLILESLSKKELLVICTLSRFFFHEVLPLLHRNVDLVNSQISQLISWSEQIKRRPELAQKVRSLSLPTGLRPEYETHPLIEIRLPLHHAMHAMNNLQSLSIVEPELNFSELTEYLIPEIFLGCGFRLKSFKYQNYFAETMERLSSFIHEQDQISDWHFRGDFEIEEGFTGTLLPNISVAHILYRRDASSMSLVQLLGSRSLTRLRVDLADPCDSEDALKVLAALAPCADSVTHFVLFFDRITAANESVHALTMETIARLFPNLRFLHYSDLLLSYMTPWKWTIFPQALSRFKHLEILGIDTKTLSTPSSGRRRPSELDRFRQLAERSMSSCPSLFHIFLSDTGDHIHDGENIHFVRQAGTSVDVQRSCPLRLDTSWRDEYYACN